MRVNQKLEVGCEGCIKNGRLRVSSLSDVLDSDAGDVLDGRKGVIFTDLKVSSSVHKQALSTDGITSQFTRNIDNGSLVDPVRDDNVTNIVVPIHGSGSKNLDGTENPISILGGVMGMIPSVTILRRLHAVHH